MDVLRWDDSLDSYHHLLTKGTVLPEQAHALAKGKWTQKHVIQDLESGDVRMALDSSKAVSDLNTRGFHEFRHNVEVSVIESGRNK